MKRHALPVVMLCLLMFIQAQITHAQAPGSFSFQAVVRDASNDLVTSSSVGMQISLLQGSATGTAVYVETHSPTTNANGLVSIQVGSGTVVSGTFASIDWSDGPYFIKSETDPTGGTSYTITGTQQLLSVPYALYAETSGSTDANWTASGTHMYSSNAGNVGIGTSTPAEKLDVSGKTKTTDFQMTNGAANGYVLASDASGNGSWVAPSSLGGDAINYVGTSYLGISSGAGSTGTSEGTTGNLYNIAIGDSALNANTTADNSIALGQNALKANTTASNNIAIGQNALQAVNGFVYYAQYPDLAIGYNALKTSNYAGGNIAIGYQSQQSTNGDGNSTGAVNTSLGTYSLKNNTSGLANVAVGVSALQNNTTGYSNSGIGGNTLASNTTGYENTAVGQYAGGTVVANSTVANTTGFRNTFVGANAGSGSNNLSNATAIGYNAMVGSSNSLVLGNGANVGIGTSTPSEKLHVSDGTLLSSGTFGSSTSLAVSGAGTRMFYYPRKAAFRAGAVTGTQWDDTNIGDYSIGLGYNAKASGLNSFATGNNAVASGANSVALGYFSTASGEYSLTTGHQAVASARYSASLGYFTTASGDYSLAAGHQAIASGNNAISLGYFNTASGQNAFAAGEQSEATGQNSVSLGLFTDATGTQSFASGIFSVASGTSSFAANSYTTAESYAETVFGQYNTDYTPTATTSWNSADRLFVVGNGTASGSRSDALTVMKSGNIGIGTSAPVSTLDVNGSIGAGFKTPLVAGTTNPDATAMVWRYTSGTGTITLPTASTCEGRIIVIINQTGTSRTISTYRDLVTNTQTSLGSSVALWLMSDGSEWWQIK